MKNIFIESLKNEELPTVAGMEAFKLGEHFTNIISEFSLGLDRKLASMKSSMHLINYDKARSNTLGLNFFKVGLSPVPVSVYYDPNKLQWEQYAKIVMQGIPMVSTLKDESSLFYDWLKRIAATGKVARSFRYSISNYDQLVGSMEEFIKDTPDNHVNRNVPFNSLYGNFDLMFTLIEQYNQSVKHVRTRDLELISKQLDEIKRMGDLLINKIKVNDIVLNERDVNEVVSSLNYFTRSVNVAGAIIGMINELREVFDGQCIAVSKIKS